jgi:hypothetical protein
MVILGRSRRAVVRMRSDPMYGWLRPIKKSFCDKVASTMVWSVLDVFDFIMSIISLNTFN